MALNVSNYFTASYNSYKYLFLHAFRSFLWYSLNPVLQLLLREEWIQLHCVCHCDFWRAIQPSLLLPSEIANSTLLEGGQLGNHARQYTLLVGVNFEAIVCFRVALSSFFKLQPVAESLILKCNPTLSKVRARTVTLKFHVSEAFRI